MDPEFVISLPWLPECLNYRDESPIPGLGFIKALWIFLHMISCDHMNSSFDFAN